MRSDALKKWLRRRTPKHRHSYKRVGYGGAGWWLLRCECGAEEIG